jgi:hypothetical protein
MVLVEAGGCESVGAVAVWLEKVRNEQRGVWRITKMRHSCLPAVISQTAKVAEVCALSGAGAGNHLLRLGEHLWGVASFVSSKGLGKDTLSVCRREVQVHLQRSA